MTRKIIVSESRDLWIEEQPVEVVERKGFGHPDSLCDGISERISVEYVRWCQANLGMSLHHNFDKVQLVAGEVAIRFGGGQMLRPIRIQIAGRGTVETPDGRPIPVHLIAIDAAKAHLRETMRHLDPDRHCVVDCYAGRGAGELVHVVEQVSANDTSVGVAHWPLSQLEQMVYETARYMNLDLINLLPIGEDIKVMGVRLARDITLTCAVPFLAAEIASLNQYREAKTAVQQAILRFATSLTARQVQVEVNTADDETSGHVYLTLTGTSGECGDDGATGRGNRVTGLITPFRPMSLEAAAGKNPISHVGKLYNVLALLAAQAIVERVPAVRQAQVIVLSQIGRPLDQPFIATARVTTTDSSLTPAIQADVSAVLDEYLANVDYVRQKIINREVNLY
ncbi:MAG TPA: methionine adenosyltransferase [Anaerolineae bacterium]